MHLRYNRETGSQGPEAQRTNVVSEWHDAKVSETTCDEGDGSDSKTEE